MKDSQQLTVVVGANGAGKTTWTRRHNHDLPRRFYNADSIAEGLGDADDPALQREARALVDGKIREHLIAGAAFGFESTYSGKSRPDLVREAKARDYTTRAIFIGTDNYDINIARVRKRAQEGGHNIPMDEIVRRWKSAWTNLLETWDVLDRIEVIDNSGSVPRVVARKARQQVTLIGTLPHWARDVAARYGKRSGERQSAG